jgi:hypothetical protein
MSEELNKQLASLASKPELSGRHSTKSRQRQKRR